VPAEAPASVTEAPPEDEPPTEPTATSPAEDAVVTPDPGGEPDADLTGQVPSQVVEAPPTLSGESGPEPDDEAETAPSAADPTSDTGGASNPRQESGPTVDRGSRGADEELADLNGDRTEAEPQDEMQLDRGGSIEPGEKKRRRGLFRRGGSG
jgi:hypothetical protein